MIWFQAIINIILPVYFLWWAYKTDQVSRRLWFAEVLSGAMFIGFIFVISPWHIYFYYLRYVWLLLFVIAVVLSYQKVKDKPLKGPKNDGSYKFSMGLNVILAVYFGVFLSQGISGYFLNSSDREEAIELDFPLKDGVYSVGQGGAHTAINYHHSHPSQAYAYDILQINGWGLRANGLTPSENSAYHIYGQSLYSPCTGTVTAAVDEYEDIPPLEPPSEVEEPAGNHVIINCKDTEVLIAHIKPGTVAVEEGNEVESGDILGEIGNTGNTTEPHLHIHAERDGEGVPITFDGRFLKRNSLIFN
ncbi:M23 family metallopeptidase [Jeotgalibacillus campisalis]|uniref:Cell wall endopeptidase, family M23/M37 n=1 Tax=Jeotgalibacillus campisalis TaxID=220754 RepID=A0A0C2SAX8_9BACL|nr:M23 family metallopeptidase [Jeotgalibacillus campisalis]KIL51094.1 cell wall endopeptidase, family M23/M37 [Jeotgalibacillus campisalis]